jgi:hypothetical protein
MYDVPYEYITLKALRGALKKKFSRYAICSGTDVNIPPVPRVGTTAAMIFPHKNSYNGYKK